MPPSRWSGPELSQVRRTLRFCGAIRTVLQNFSIFPILLRSFRFLAECSCFLNSGMFGARSGRMGGRFQKIPTQHGWDIRLADGKETLSSSKQSALTTSSGTIPLEIREANKRTSQNVTGV